MTDEQIAVFIERLLADKVRSWEFEALTGTDIRNINRSLKNRRELLKERHVDAIFTSRMAVWSSNPKQRRTHSESEVLAELGIDE